MDRTDLERLATSSEFIHRLTRDDIAQIVKMLDATDTERADQSAIRDSQIIHAYALAADARAEATDLKGRIDDLASYLDEHSDSRAVRAYALAAEVRSSVGVLKERIESLASYLDYPN